jgi:hypothetical protein
MSNTKETTMKLKDDVIDKWESGKWTLYEIAEYYCTPVENIIRLLGLQENPLNYELH